MQVVLAGFFLSTLSWIAYLQFRSSTSTLEQRVATINANFGTGFACEPFLGRDGHGFLFDEGSGKVCYLTGEEGELLDFDYFRSWGLAGSGDHAFIFLTTDKNRPVIKITVGSLAEMAIWRKRLADTLPPIVPAALAA
ncbi:MAG: hypothetical protein JWM42_1447 [Burkholderia sp.]|nr:hypothetical protein [Burkholderia sp.]